MIGARTFFVIAVMLCMQTGRVLAGDEVLITGGRDGSGQNYSWTVRNQGTSPIVWIEFPHYHADLFTIPAGWKQECTFLNLIGSEDKPGVCRAMPESVSGGIAPGSSEQFAMRLSRIGAEKGRGTVLVKFADGKVAAINGVTLPVASSWLDHYLPALALGAIFIVAILLHHRSRKKKSVTALPIEPN